MDEQMRPTELGETTALDTSTSSAVRASAGRNSGDASRVCCQPPECVLSFVQLPRACWRVALSGIAETYDGSAMNAPAIVETNEPMFNHQDKIYPVQVLRIPPLEG
jgi:hypothetical protein